jgi:transcriptional regulator with XRE-family HTH domain
MGTKKYEVMEEELYLHIGQALAARREELGLKQSDVARKVGFSRTSICGIEGGDHFVRLIDLYKICAVLSLEPREILPSMKAVTTDPPKFDMPILGEMKKVTRSEAKALRKLAKRLVRRK